MAELTLIVLGDTPPRGIHWSRPGAIHQARWMAKPVIFYEDVHVFLSSWSKDEKTVVKLERLNLFLGLFISPMWMSSTLAADAPANDLQFMKDMGEVQENRSRDCSGSATKLEKPQVVLTQEVVPFALFGSRPSDKEEAKDIVPSCTPLRSQIASDEGNLCSLRLQPRGDSG
ncbi:hypothetical protein GWK47_033797 [Chionoecetes opilio]|uniref:Uncharacterized protein n=1 Tax=Chionoecetes opilio TaxID=41210 RepID=A0A8J5D065_CHIOP|nr:hypothetical protein GWK47_033797 [Chionoecetes opilio]